jgi:hypothetical protein
MSLFLQYHDFLIVVFYIPETVLKASHQNIKNDTPIKMNIIVITKKYFQVLLMNKIQIIYKIFCY